MNLRGKLHIIQYIQQKKRLSESRCIIQIQKTKK